MKNKTFIIGLLIVALCVIAMLFGKPYSSNVLQPQQAVKMPEQSFDPEALAIRDKLYAKSKEYGAKTKRQTELQKELAILEAEKTVLAEAAAGYDRVLCAEFRLAYVRPAPAMLSGSLVTGCDFQ